MKKILFVSVLFFMTISLWSQSKKKKDINAIKQMCGCFEVQFNFAETFVNSLDEDYVPSKNYHSGALEWAQLVTENFDEISIQHILITGDINAPYIIKHWRQDWLYENQDFYFYDYNNKWNYKFKTGKEVKGQWTQKVYQVDDSPRYEGSSSWVHVDGKSFWENTTPAPLPRREFSKRKDYNVLLRSNRHEITNYGWFHGQNNEKVDRINSIEEEVLAFEVGYNYYKRVANDKCKYAKEWWLENEKKWDIVRNIWAEIYSQNKNLSLKSEYNGKRLYEYLLFSNEYKDYSEIDKLISSFIIK